MKVKIYGNWVAVPIEALPYLAPFHRLSASDRKQAEIQANRSAEKWRQNPSSMFWELSKTMDRIERFGDETSTGFVEFNDAWEIGDFVYLTQAVSSMFERRMEIIESIPAKLPVMFDRKLLTDVSSASERQDSKKLNDCLQRWRASLKGKDPQDLQSQDDAPTPVWDDESRTLSFHGSNRIFAVQTGDKVIRILDVFQEFGWRKAEDNPLPNKDDAKAAIRTLNRSGLPLRFSKDGERILWREVVSK
jgi:hypothetical protein